MSPFHPRLLLPVGRRRRDGRGCLDLGGEERLHQSSPLQDVRRLCLHTGSGRSHRHGNRRAGLLRHLQGAEEATADGKRSSRGGSRLHMTLTTFHPVGGRGMYKMFPLQGSENDANLMRFQLSVIVVIAT